MQAEIRTEIPKPSEKKKKYDVIIIGSGPAGYTAGIYTSRAKRDTLIISGVLPGGQLMLTTCLLCESRQKKWVLLLLMMK